MGPDASSHWTVQEFREHVTEVQFPANHPESLGLYYDLETETTDG